MERILGLLNCAKQGDKEARNTLVEENVGLVWSIVKRFTNRGYDPEDLFQIGVIGLIKAIDYFDLSYDVKFSTYAVPMIAGEIKRFFRDDGMIKVSRSIKDHGALVRKAIEHLSDELGREPTTEEIAKACNLSMEDVVVAIEAAAEVESLNKVLYQGDGGQILLMDRIEDSVNVQEKIINQYFVRDMLSRLPEEEKQIIVWRYYEQKTQSQIAKKLGISQVQVSRMEKRILESMRRC